MEDLEQETAERMGEGEVILIGYFNARTNSRQTHLSPLEPTQKEDLVSQEDWPRDSWDNISTDSHGDALLRLCNITQLIIANGVKKWPNTNKYTCYTAA